MDFVEGDRIEMFPQIKSFGNVGALGDVIFEVSSWRVRTFDDFKRKIKARYATHELVGQKSALEYLGEDVGEVTFKMVFNRKLGVNPERELKRLRKMCESGSVEYLVIGTEIVGEQWVVESLTEEASVVDHFGNILIAAVEVRLKEYRYV